MSDLFNDEHQPETDKDFNPYEHFQSLCEGGRLELRPFCKVDYKKGWAKIMETLISAIKQYQVEITEITCRYAELDIKFFFNGKTNEVKVWRAINMAILESRETCMRCGGNGRRMMRGENMIVMCRSCLHEDESNGITGTWLDRY